VSQSDNPYAGSWTGATVMHSPEAPAPAAVMDVIAQVASGSITHASVRFRSHQVGSDDERTGVEMLVLRTTKFDPKLDSASRQVTSPGSPYGALVQASLLEDGDVRWSVRLDPGSLAAASDPLTLSRKVQAAVLYALRTGQYSVLPSTTL